MRQIRSLFLMLMTVLLGFTASANVTIKVVVDHPERVEVYDQMGYVTHSLTSGVNTIELQDPYGYGGGSMTIRVTNSSDYLLTGISVGDTALDLYDTTSKYMSIGNESYNDAKPGDTIYVTTGSYAESRTNKVTVTVDNANAVSLQFNNAVTRYSLQNGDNEVYFADFDTPFTIRRWNTEYDYADSSSPLNSVKYNGEEVEFVTYTGYSITPANNSTITITAGQEVKYSVSFAAGSVMAAVDYMYINGSRYDNFSQPIEVSPGAYATLYFKDDYTITNTKINSESVDLQFGCISFQINSDCVISFDAAPVGGGGQDPEEVKSYAYFNITGPTDGLKLYAGYSQWDSEIEITSSSVSYKYSGDSHSFFIKAENGYKITSITKVSPTNVQTNVTYITGGTAIYDLPAGYTVNITLEQEVKAKITFNVSNLEYFEGGVYVENNKTSKLLVEGENVIEFDPNDPNEYSFTIKPAASEIYSVTYPGGVSLSTKTIGSTIYYNISQANDGDVVNIVAKDPNYVPPTAEPARVNFAEGTVFASIKSVMLNNTDDVDNWQSGFDTKTLNYVNLSLDDDNYTDFVVTFNGVEQTLTRFSKDATLGTYYYNAVSLYLEQTTNTILVTARKVERPVVVQPVEFTITVPAGATAANAVKITDVSDTANPVNVEVTSSFTYEFTADNNYINIAGKPGFKVTSLIVSPARYEEDQNTHKEVFANAWNDPVQYATDPEETGSLSLPNNQYNGLYLRGHDKVSITVETAAIEEYSFTLNVTGDVSAFSIMTTDGQSLTFTEGETTHSLETSPTTYRIFPTDDLYLVKVTSKSGSEEIKYLHDLGGFSAYEFYVYDGDVVTVIVDEPTYASFTVRVSGDLDRIDSFYDEEGEEYELALGNNSFEIINTPFYIETPQGDTNPFYVIRLDGEDLEAETEGKGAKAHLIYTIEPRANSVLEIITDAPVYVPHFTVNINGTLEKVGTFMGEHDRTDVHGDFTLGENSVEVPADDTNYNYILYAAGESALYDVKVNGVSKGSNVMYMMTLKSGDIVDIYTDFPEGNSRVTWNFDGLDSGVISSIDLGDGNGPLTIDNEEAFTSLFNGFEVANGTQISYNLDSNGYYITSVSHNGSTELTAGIHYIVVSSDTEITISGRQKKVFDYTLRTNDYRHTLVYENGIYNLPTTLSSNETTMSINEISGNLKIYIKSSGDYLISSCTVDGNPASLVEGYYEIEPQENSIVNVTIAEEPRPYTAVFYVQDVEAFSYLQLNRYQGLALSTVDEEKQIISGYNIFNFNDSDVSASADLPGFTLNGTMAEGFDVSKVRVYLNGVEQTITATDGNIRLANIIFKDGDVFKVYYEEPANHSVVFHIAEDHMENVTFVIDRIVDYDPFATSGSEAPMMRAASTNDRSVNILSGSEVTVYTKDIDNPTINFRDLDNSNEYYESIPAEGYTFTVDKPQHITIGSGFTTLIPEFIDTTDKMYDVYDLRGVCVKRNATFDDVKRLTPGIYIVGGHKVRVF